MASVLLDSGNTVPAYRASIGNTVPAYRASRRIMRLNGLMPVFRRDGLRDTLTTVRTLKIFALVRPDTSFVCSIKTAINL